MNCSTCQDSLPVDAHFCPACGTPTHPATAGSSSHPATGITQRLATSLQSPAPSPHGTPICGQCHQTMEHGFIPDFDDRTGGEPQFWVRGSPERHPQTGNVQVRDHNLIPLTAY